MTPHAIMRALVAGLLALIVAATALLAGSDVDAVPGGEPAVETQWQVASVVPVLKRVLVPLPELPIDLLASTLTDYLVLQRVDAHVRTATPSARLQSRLSTYPARGPPGSAP